MLELDIVTAERRVHDTGAGSGVTLPAQVKSVLVPTAEGYRQIFAGHTPLLALVSTGRLTFEDASGHEVKMMVSGGYLEVSEDSVTVMCENAAHVSEIDVDAEKASLAEIEAKLREMGSASTDDPDFMNLRVRAEQSATKLGLL